MLLILALGNPGREYADTRHNVGYCCVDVVAKRHGLRFNQKRASSLLTIGEICGTRVALAKPLTYMNLSGEAARQLLKELSVEPGNMLVVFDDVDLALGKLRMRRSGSAGTHNGVRSVVQCLGTENFPRLRIGISQPPPEVDVSEFVLSPFEPAERDAAREAVARAADAVVSLIKRGWTTTMTEYNR